MPHKSAIVMFLVIYHPLCQVMTLLGCVIGLQQSYKTTTIKHFTYKYVLLLLQKILNKIDNVLFI